MIWFFLILGDRAASLDPRVVPRPCNMDIMKHRFYGARIDRLGNNELAAPLMFADSF